MAVARPYRGPAPLTVASPRANGLTAPAPIRGGAHALAHPNRGLDFPTVRQFTYNENGATVFCTTPRPGNLLFFGTGSIQQGANTPSGGGATWVQIGRQVAGGAQIECDFWVGLVGSSPTNRVDRTFTNAGNNVLVEINAAGAGLVLASTGGSSSGAILTPYIRALGRGDVAGWIFTALWYVDRQAMGAVVPDRWNVFDCGEIVSNVRFRMAIHASRPGAIERFSAPTGGANNHCAVLGLVA